MVSGALFALTQISVVMAQDTQAEVVEGVVVTAKPIKASQMSSIEAKRSAENLVDLVSADAIGRFPDPNLVNSIGRLPSMSIERDQGRARYLNLRGAPPTICIDFTMPSRFDSTDFRDQIIVYCNISHEG